MEGLMGRDQGRAYLVSRKAHDDHVRVEGQFAGLALP
jgi:hypothetical protein